MDDIRRSARRSDERGSGGYKLTRWRAAASRRSPVHEEKVFGAYRASRCDAVWPAQAGNTMQLSPHWPDRQLPRWWRAEDFKPG
jgi:hypothetical protein